jgi:tetratricopeptide (TPR) repeat protein
LIQDKKELTAKSKIGEADLIRANKINPIKKNPDEDIIKVCPSILNFDFSITQEEKNLAESISGLSKGLSPSELKLFIEITQDLFEVSADKENTQNNTTLLLFKYKQTKQLLKESKLKEILNMSTHLAAAKNFITNNQYLEAQSALLEIIRNDSDDLDAFLLLASVFYKLGLSSKAIDLIRELLRINPNNQEAQSLLFEIQKSMTKPQSSLFQIALDGDSEQTLTPPKTSNNVFNHSHNFYGSVILNPLTLAEYAKSEKCWNEILGFHQTLAPDKYVDYLDAYYSECIKRFGDHWVYYDIVNVLYAASRLTQPINYLEIGVRRGRSVSTVAKGCPSVNIYAFDMWQQNYAGMENPGPKFVQDELNKHGHAGKLDFINGNSHETLPLFFKQNPGLDFDMITVDGDHTEEGALQDLRDVLPNLALGGIIIFDDISHPQHMYLADTWKKAIREHGGIKTFEYTELGYGVAFGIRVK